MNPITLAVLTLYISSFARAVEPAESQVKEIYANPFVVEQKSLGSLTNSGNFTRQRVVPNVSILDKPIQLRIEVRPLIPSELKQTLNILGR